MRILALIIFVLLFAGCENFPGGKSSQDQDKKNDVFVDVIPESILKDANTETNDSDIAVLEELKTEEGQTPTVLPSDKKAADKQVPHINEVSVDKDQTDPDTQAIALQELQKTTGTTQKKMVSEQNNITPVPHQEKQIAEPVSVPETRYVTHKGSLIIAGNDKSGQNLSPRKYIHLSFAVFEAQAQAEFVEFQIYAVPLGGRLRRTGYYLLGYNKFARLINGQAQFTRYWNGKNTRGQFLPRGKYNLYLYYKIKNRSGQVISTGGRYWGGSRNFYVNLY